MAKKSNKLSKKQQLHDEFVRKQLSDKEQASDLFRTFLPQNIVSKLELEKLELDNTSYITPELKTYFSDLVWLCPYGKQQVRIALLLEHKSSPVAYPHIQLLRYMLEVWQRNLDNKEAFLPIIPIIFYHGKGKWNNRKLSEYFKGIDDNLLRVIPTFDYQLININDYTPEQLTTLKLGLLRNVLIALLINQSKEAFKKGFELIFFGINDYAENDKGKNFLQTTLVYLLGNSELSEEEFNEFINQIPEPSKEITMSTYDAIMNKGILQGVEAKTIEVIKNLYLANISLEIIAKGVQLPVKRVRQILDDLGLE